MAQQKRATFVAETGPAASAEIAQKREVSLKRVKKIEAAAAGAVLLTPELELQQQQARAEEQLRAQQHADW